jgi:Ni/Co efflux regulator RcnB
MKSEIFAMKKFILAISALALVAGAAGPVIAQPNNRGGWAQDQGASHHWNRGQRMGQNDWNGARRVDYRQHHLRRPPHGYEWRESNGQYVLAAVATGLIASAILSGGR